MRLVTAAIYPAFVLLAVCAAVTVLVTVTVPAVAGIYARSGVQLPLPTRLVVRGAETAVALAPFAAMLAAAAAAWVATAPREMRRQAMWAVLERVPVAGRAARMLSVAVALRTLGDLLDSGVPIIEAVRLAADASPAPAVEEAVRSAENAVASGAPLSRCLPPALFTRRAISLLTAGEQSGRLAEALNRAAGALERDAWTALERLQASAEPVLTLLLAGLVGVVALATYLPVFGLPGIIGR